MVKKNTLRDFDKIPLQGSSFDSARGTRNRVGKSARPLIRYYARLLATLCTLSWMSGVLVFMVSEALHRDVTYDEKHVSRPSPLDLHLLSGAGGFLFLMGPLGLWASLHLQHDILCCFTWVVFLSSVFEMCVGAITLSFKGAAIQENILEHLTKEVKHMEFIFRLQKELGCCGSFSWQDWLGSAWWGEQNRLGRPVVVPKSCCIHEPEDKEYKICNHGDYMSLLHPNLVHQKGCQKLLIVRRESLMASCGSIAILCGLFQLAAFLGIHYILNLLLPLQKSLPK